SAAARLDKRLSREKEERVRLEVAHALVRVRPGHSGAVAFLLRACTSGDKETVAKARRALGSGGKAVVPALVAALKDKRPAVRRGTRPPRCGSGRPQHWAILAHPRRSPPWSATCVRTPTGELAWMPPLPSDNLGLPHGTRFPHSWRR